MRGGVIAPNRFKRIGRERSNPSREEQMRIDTEEAKTYLDPEFINAYSLASFRRHLRRAAGSDARQTRGEPDTLRRMPVSSGMGRLLGQEILQRPGKRCAGKFLPDSISA